MVYNLTNITAANDLYNIMYQTNVSSGYLLFGGMMLILFITFMVVFKKENFKKTFLAASFFMSVISTFAYILGWIPVSLLVVCIIGLGAGLMIYLFVEEG